jgi:hypothetical protein
MYVRCVLSSPLNVYSLSFLYTGLAAAYLAFLWVNLWSISVLYYWQNKELVCFPQKWNEADSACCIGIALVCQFVGFVSLTLQKEKMLSK